MSFITIVKNAFASINTITIVKNAFASTINTTQQIASTIVEKLASRRIFEKFV